MKPGRSRRPQGTSGTFLGFRSVKHRISFSILFVYLCLSVFLCGSPGLLFGQGPPAKPQPARERIDLLVTGGTVVTMDGQRRILEHGAEIGRASCRERV